MLQNVIAGTTAETPSFPAPFHFHFLTQICPETSNTSLKNPFPTLLPVQTAHSYPEQKQNPNNRQTDRQATCMCTHAVQRPTVAQDQCGVGRVALPGGCSPLGSGEPCAVLRKAALFSLFWSEEILPGPIARRRRAVEGCVGTQLQHPALNRSQRTVHKQSRGHLYSCFQL